MQTALASLFALLAAAAPPPVPLQPVKPWVVDYADTYCTASRQYHDGYKPVQLVLRPSPRGNLLQLFVIRNGHSQSAAHVPVSLGFAGRTVKATALLYGTKKDDHQILLTSLGADASAGIDRAREIGIHAGGTIDRSFAVPDIGKVMAALATCNADLQTLWNVSDAAEAAIATRAKPLASLGSYVSSDDYPAQAVRDEDSGKTRVMLLVDEQGKVRDCLLEETSGNASLDAMTCIAMVQRAKFHPALNAAGKPVKSIYSQAIMWRISS